MSSFCVHRKREAICALCLPVSRQGSTPLTNFVTYPLCFTAYINCDVTSQLASLKGGGALYPKNQAHTTPFHLKGYHLPLIKYLTAHLEVTTGYTYQV